MEKEKWVSPPRENFIIGGERLNIRSYLDNKWEKYDKYTPSSMVDSVTRKDYPAQKIKPGDREAVKLIRSFRQMGLTTKEYFATMPTLLEDAVRKDGSWDVDFINVARFLTGSTVNNMDEKIADDDVPLYHSEKRRLIYFSNISGKLEAVRALIWKDPQMAIRKSDLIRKATSYMEKNPGLF